MGLTSGSREATSAGQLAREVSALQATLLDKLRREMPGTDVDTFAGAAQRLAEAFGAVTAAAVEPVAEPAIPVAPARARRSAPGSPRPEPAPGPPRRPSRRRHPSLYRPGHMRRRLDQLLEMHRRYGHPFCLAVFDVAGPATRNGDGGPEAALTVVGAALRDSVRLVDEPFRLEEDALCVLAPNQDTVGGVQMSERLLRTAGRAGGGGRPADRDLGRRRRLSRARLPRPIRSSTTPTKRCGGRARSASPWACGRLQDR